MKLLVGLGNPGKKYEGTRHNMGFMTIDLFSDVSKIDIDREAFQGMIGRGKLFDEDVMLLKPTTFMNLSGHSVREVMNYFKIDIDDVVIVYDDMALSPGTIRLRLSGSSGGQKGMQSIIEQLGTENIKRIRVGIGEPEYDSVDYVLSKPLKEEKELIDKAIEKAKDALVMYLKKGFDAAMNTYNRGDA
ncbi:MAG: aminoacyl-tRNA hydrolase [Bacilli bacterium]|nr:aminoacyl-tRNA hydrolase [Bacilli bacterium]